MTRHILALSLPPNSDFNTEEEFSKVRPEPSENGAHVTVRGLNVFQTLFFSGKNTKCIHKVQNEVVTASFCVSQTHKHTHSHTHVSVSVSLPVSLSFTHT